MSAKIGRAQRKSAIRVATAASEAGGECLFRAVLNRVNPLSRRIFCRRSKGGKEPIASDAARFTNDRSWLRSQKRDNTEDQFVGGL